MNDTNAAPGTTWTIRAYRPGDERALVALVARAFGRPISEEHWRWKFKQLPAPVENVWLAFDGERPISQYTGIPVRWEVGLDQYCLLHGGPPEGWPRQIFRSLRPRPLSDPLAYLLGQTERRRLAALVSGARQEEHHTRGRSRSFLTTKRAKSAKGGKG